MKEFKILISLCLMTLIASLSSCNKESDNQDGDPAKAEVLLEKNSYYPYEMAQLSVKNFKSSLTGAQLLIDENTQTEYQIMDTVIVFIMPVLQAGSHTLKLVVGEETYPMSFIQTELTEAGDPDQYFASISESYQTTVNFLEQNKDSLDPERKQLLESDMQIIDEWLEQFTQQYQSLTPDEKKAAMLIIQANEYWLKELKESILKLSQYTGQPSRDYIQDWDKDVEQAMQDFVKAKINVIKHVPKIAAWITLGALVGSIFPGPGTGVGAAVGAGIALGNLIGDLIILNNSIDHLLDLSFLPFEQMIADMNRNALEFTSGEYGSLGITIKYRSPYSADMNSSVPIASTFVNGVVAVRQVWSKLVSKLPKLLNYEPADISKKTTYKTKTIRIHSNYLSLTDVGNNKVTSMIDNSDGEFKVKFTTTETIDQEVSFNVNYFNANTVEMTCGVQAMVRVGGYSLLGNWEAISLEDFGLGIYHDYFFPQCPNLQSSSAAIIKQTVSFTETIMTVKVDNHEIMYDYVNLNFDNCSYSSVSTHDEYGTSGPMPNPYIRNGNTVTITEEGIEYPFTILFSGPNTLTITNLGTYTRY
jgi:hypothetical protein